MTIAKINKEINRQFKKWDKDLAKSRKYLNLSHKATANHNAKKRKKYTKKFKFYINKARQYTHIIVNLRDERNKLENMVP